MRPTGRSDGGCLDVRDAASPVLYLRAALAAAALPFFGFLNCDWIAREASARRARLGA
jgi:hypothetical protein